MGISQESTTKPVKRFSYLLIAVVVLIGLVAGAALFCAVNGLTYMQNRNAYSFNQPVQNITIYQNITSISELYGRVKDSVVTIQGILSSSSSIGEIQGSGFIYNYSGQIVIVTNFHVINSAKNITTTFDNGKAFPATVIGSDPYADLAILQLGQNVPSELLKPLIITSSSNLQVGDPVLAVGNPFGLTGSLTSGLVSQIGRTFSEDTAGGYMIANALQIDAPINPGNSGGPLLNYVGDVVGITTAAVSDSQGLGLAIPSDTILREIPNLVNKGYYTEHAWLGLSSIDMNYYISTATGEKFTYGVLVAQVAQNGPAQTAGIKGGTSQVVIAGQSYPIGGDLIVAINGTAVINGDGLSSYLDAKTLPDDTAVLSLVRSGTEVSSTVVLGTRPPPAI